MRKIKYQGNDAYLSASASAASLASKGSSSTASMYEKKSAEANEYMHVRKDKAFETAVGSWPSPRLRSYLEVRGIHLPDSTRVEDLRTAVRNNAHRVRVYAGFTDEAFDTWTSSELIRFLGDNAKGTRDELIKKAKKEYETAKEKGGKEWHRLADRGAKMGIQGVWFDDWNEADLKSLLHSFGVKVSGLSRKDLLSEAKRHSKYFAQGPDYYTTGWVSQFRAFVNRAFVYIQDLIVTTSGSAQHAGEKAGDRIKESATIGKDRAKEATQKAGDHAYEKGQQAYDKVKEEL